MNWFGRVDGAQIRPRRLIATIGMLGALVAGPAAAPLAASPAHPRHHERTYFAQAGDPGHRSVRPSRLTISGDGAFGARHMSWTHWGQRRAVGTGQSVVDDCSPDCAHGKVSHDPVRVTLRTPKERCGHRFFTRGVFYWPGKPPQGAHHVHHHRERFGLGVDRHCPQSG